MFTESVKRPAPLGLVDPFDRFIPAPRRDDIIILEVNMLVQFDKLDALCGRIDLTDRLNQQAVDAVIHGLDLARSALRKAKSNCRHYRAGRTAYNYALGVTRATETFLSIMDKNN